MIARENGLEGLAEMILAQAPTSQSVETIARAYLSEKAPGIEDALAGARDIVAEMISDHPEVRSQTRQKALLWGSLVCSKEKDAQDPKRVYELYYAFDYRVDRLRPHQVLAINRGEEEKVLTIKVSVDERDWLGAVTTYFRVNRRSPWPINSSWLLPMPPRGCSCPRSNGTCAGS